MDGSGGGWGIGATIVGALRGYGHAGARAETLRAEVRRMTDGVSDDAIDAALEQLQQEGEVGEGTNGPGFLALAELVRAHAAEEMEAEVAAGAERPLDALPVLAALQLLGDKGGSVEELQRELEASGAGRHPLGRVFAVALQLVEAGKARREGADEPEARFWLVLDSPAAVLERRTKLVQQLAQAAVDLEKEGESRCGAVLRSEVIAAGGAREDIDALLSAGVAVERVSHDEDDEDDEEAKRDPAYELKSEAFADVLRIGAATIALRTVESPVAAGGTVLRLAPDAPETAAPAGDASGFERAAVEKAEIERKRADALQAQLNTIRENLRRADLNPDWFSAPPPPAKPPEEIVEFKERRIIDQAEKGRILDEILVLERQVAAKEANFQICKSEHKAALEVLQEQIKALKEDSDSNARTVIIQARKERDWTAGVLRIVALEDGRVLEEKPLPKGEQRTIPGAEAPPPAAAAEASQGTPAPQEAIEAFKESFAEKNGKAEPEGASAPAAAPAPAASVIVDVAALPALERDVYEALRKANRPVTTAGLPDAVKAATGKTVGPAMKAKVEAAAAALVERCVAVREGDAFRVLGAPATAAPVKSAKERIWDALAGEPKTKAELRMQAGATEEEVDDVLGALKKAGKIATTGKAKGTKYARAGAPGPEATV